MMTRAAIVAFLGLLVFGAIRASEPSPIDLAASIPIPLELTGK